MTDCSRCAGTNTSGPNHWSERIRDIVDFPKPGIVFKDITPLLSDGPDFASALDEMAQPWRTTPLDAVLGIEARGFILGAALARELRTGFVPVRKPGKLPGRTLIQEYALEYGTDRIEMHEDALPRGARVLIVDDVLATGGTLRAALGLAAQLEFEVVGAAVLVELQGLQGRQKWVNDVPLLATLSY
ncbi:adenine phosphoribosyltransferase [Xanthomonas citri pv. fuscans]|uniref:Adenine phosphoribosyltransferase n=1 Tax=Xanthomonas citri pv. fuscans TaxID=366649 RepID=A0AB34Q546_XANCI|nr:MULTISPECIES: adenine phosphoribosyltransferase [Xanthomonas]ATB58907.1 Adenine phosphoribosyl transferase [Xanthomonas citri pv. fuscans]ATS63377.1 adenine phosphoribosyltransferase [Xanthomonas citri pv. phaseoli var. fuscans]ATS69204.1 adenine phosphoribosyltransferase [Xanthomonas citri pv. phaseoli var. fuscans]ATS71586.1 adenine phosphoribosyltransferase [Xanthomonas citri pv. phaseoli var. fuscans]ATS78175.1 adenine phosphoribosyltransferase [Xanthomonas citri pv. phaseoli var. fusca